MRPPGQSGLASRLIMRKICYVNGTGLFTRFGDFLQPIPSTLRECRLNHLAVGVLIAVLAGCQSTIPAPRPGAGSSAAAAAMDQAPISGMIDVTDAVEVRESDSLFVILRRKGVPGPPLAVLRLDGPNFPVPYSIGPESRMIQGNPFLGPFEIEARLSRSGEPTPQSGDVEGIYPEPVEAGAGGINILLGKIVP